MSPSFSIPSFLRERRLRLFRRGSKRPCTHLPIGFVLTILLAIRKIDLYLYLCVRFDAALAEQSFRTARCLRKTAIRSYLSILKIVGSDLR